MRLTHELKEKLEKRKPTIGSWLQIADPVVAEIMSGAGFEWLVVDLEHSVIELSSAQVLFQVIESQGLPALVRLSDNDQVQIKRVLDAGACGIIVPNVNSAKDAKKAIISAKYPPQGVRGTGIARAQGYGASFKEYFDKANKDIVVIVQIEHRDAVDNIKEIIETPIDAVLIGPYDISASYGVAGEFDHPKVIEAINKVKEVTKSSSKALGIHVVYPEKDEVLRYLKEGFSFIAYSTDSIILQNYSGKDLSYLKKAMNL
jgi:2-dehydro-3-deoxyglucarate aldolase